MNVSELIEELKEQPQDALVWFCYDGGLREPVAVVWLARSGVVGLAGWDADLYDEQDRPADAPDQKNVPSWYIS